MDRNGEFVGLWSRAIHISSSVVVVCVVFLRGVRAFQLKLAKELNQPVASLHPLYYSLAQTYADDDQHGKAIVYFRKELQCQMDQPAKVDSPLVFCSLCTPNHHIILSYHRNNITVKLSLYSIKLS